MRRSWIPGWTVVALAGCTTPLALPAGHDAYALVPPAGPRPILAAYRLKPYDHINITVFDEPDLSFNDVEIGSSGTLTLPFVGITQAAGKTVEELRGDVAAALAHRVVKHPEVVIALASSPSRTITIEGSVNQPGVYPITEPIDLLAALAMARGPDRVAKLHEVAIFRTVDGAAMGAKFDVAAIRRGEAANPQILPNDTVVVGLSNARAAWRDVLQASPVLALFTRL